MGTRACLSVLLTAGALLVPLFGATAQETASSTPFVAPVETASSTEPLLPLEFATFSEQEVSGSTATSSSEVAQEPFQTLAFSTNSGPSSPFERGFGVQVQELPTQYESHAGYGAFIIHANVDGVPVANGDVLDIVPRNNIHLVASTTITGTSAIGIDEVRALAEARHVTIALYRGVPGNAQMVAGTFSISEVGVLSDIGGTPLTSLDLGAALSEPGEYFLVVHPEFGANEYPDGWGPHDFGGPRIDLVPRWDFWANHDFYTRQTLYQGSQVFGLLRFTVGAPTPQHQMSNVLFLPGIKGSRLYDASDSCEDSSCERWLWEPNITSEVFELFLNPSGTSRNSIYTKQRDVISRINLLGRDLYSAFGAQLTALEDTGAISGWKPIAYDWRLSLDQIIGSGRIEGDRIYYDQAVGTPYIEQTLRELASTSKSGKVTVVAHSNGGLVAKALMQKLGDAETTSLIDNVILLGAPQAGAPQTLGALLYGHKEGVPNDWLPVLVTVSQAREFALNSPASYHLLPTQHYFNALTGVEHPVARFYAGAHHQIESSAYNEVIDSLGELHAFLRADEGGRTMPDRNDLDSANVLNAQLLSYAQDVHNRLSAWSPPSGVTVYQVAGWGADTIAGYEFYEEQVRLPFMAGTVPKFRPIFVEDGDGVVPVPSALAMRESENVKNYWINLRQEREGHATLLESEHVRALIEDVLRGEEPTLAIDHVSRNGHTPWIDRPEKKLRFILHSPLTLSVTDSDGNTSGLMQDGSVIENISGSRFGQIGEMKFVSVPLGPSYSIAMHGLGAGTFSLDIEEVEGDTVVAKRTFAGLPVRVGTVASLVNGGSVNDFVALLVDTDGDGTNDIELQSGAESLAVYQPTVPTEPSETSAEQSNEAATSQSGGSSRDGSHSIQPQGNETASMPSAQETEHEAHTAAPTLGVSEAPQQHQESSLDTTLTDTQVQSTLITQETKNGPDSENTRLSASVFGAFQQVWNGFFVPLFYTIKEKFLIIISKFL